MHDPAWMFSRGTGSSGAEFRTGFLDCRLTVDELIAEGDHVWALWTMHGTHHGEWRDIPPAGKQIRLRNCLNTHRIAGGRIQPDPRGYRALALRLPADLRQLGVAAPTG